MTKTCLLVLHHSVYSGPQNTALRIHADLRRLGWETLVLMAAGPGNAQERLESAGVEVIRMPLHTIRAQINPRYVAGYIAAFLPEVFSLRQLLVNRKIDAVILGGLANPHAAIAGKLARVPVVWQILDTRLPGSLRKTMMAVVRRCADVVMFTGDALIDVHGARKLKKPCFIYYPPVDTARFEPTPQARQSTRRTLGVPDDGLVVGTVANLNPQKGLEYFVRAAEILSRNFTNLWFIVAGATYKNHVAYASRLFREAAAAKIPEGRFNFLGERLDVENVYQAMDVMVISSVPRSEGVPTTALEALACGVPVVATDVGATREVIQHDVTGYLVPALHADRLAQAIGSLLAAPDVRARMAAVARRQAEDRYNIASCARAHYLALEAAVSSLRRPANTRSRISEHGA